MTTKQKIKCGLVGCGSISKNHLSALDAHTENLDLIALCDLNQDLLDNISKERKLSCYADLSKMLKNENLDLVILCTPNGLHAKQTKEAAKAGVNIITEKPMALDIKDAQEMVKVCKDNNVDLFVVKQVRYNPYLQALKEAVQKNLFKQIYMFNLNVFWTRPQEYYDKSKWRGSKLMDGGVFMNQASHHIDLLSWLFGKPSRVSAFTETLARNIESEDSGVVNLEYEGKILGSLNVTSLTYPHNLETSLTVLGEEGTVKISGNALNSLETWNFKDKTFDKKIKDVNHSFFEQKEFGHSQFYKSVISYLNGSKESVVLGAEALNSLDVIIKIQNSSSSKETINL